MKIETSLEAYHSHLKEVSNTPLEWTFPTADGKKFRTGLWEGNVVTSWEILDEGKSNICDIYLKDGEKFQAVFESPEECFHYMNNFWDYRSK